MPKKYNIPTKTAPPRFTPIAKSTILDWQSGCLRCFKCVKRQCIYDAYSQRTFDVKNMADNIDVLCHNCLRCVQSCPGRVITKVLNPEYKRLGDSYWTPDIISCQWFQAETGRIPVSGAGYGGPFSGPGFDDMWTDMSEIVRPTRDGIHGREYISTVVDLGRKSSFLCFDRDGRLSEPTSNNIEIPIPILFNNLPLGYPSESVTLAMAQAAETLGTFMILPVDEWKSCLEPYKSHLIPLVHPDRVEKSAELFEGVKIIELLYSTGCEALIGSLKSSNPDRLVMVKLPFEADSSEQAVRLANNGADIIHFAAGRNGEVQVNGTTKFMKEMVRSVHTSLVQKGIRDTVTIIASGGIAMAEHVAKAIICGADAIAMDIPLLLALECRLCFQCENGGICPVEIENIHPEWGKTRMMNLVAAWRNQLLEVLGAMGIREVRRLRGEVGRAMFFDDLEAETFGRIFGKRKDFTAKRAENSL